jgi:oligoribonuclease
MDMEMTGLDPEKNVILEIATIVTGPDLTVLGEGPVIAIRHGENELQGMDAWNTKHHTQSGLLARVRKSAFSLAEAETATLDFIKPFTKKGMNPLCGNSIGQDKRFIFKYMPRLAEWLNYRNVDVTSVKEMVYRWYPKLPAFEKQEKHLALDDIRESIAELEYYRKAVFKDPSAVVGA